MTSPRRIAIVMSRLPRLIEPEAAWLRGLRAALRLTRLLGATLVCTEGTAGAEFVRRGAERLAIDVEVLPVEQDSLPASVASADCAPERDRLLIQAADTIMVLGLRTNGNVHRLLRACLLEGRRVALVDLPGLQAHAARNELIRLGAACWNPATEEQGPILQPAGTASPEVCHSCTCEISPVPTGSDWAYVTHTTRSCPGPWPGQDTEAYIDSLLDNAADADHSALATLTRIIRQRLLRASSQLIRGGYPVVCLTQVPLHDLPRLRQFRAPRTRWDFEPFGLCINREWLRQRGARPVTYGTDATWDAITEVDRPYFQFAHRPDPSAATDAVDWTIEQEWRHVADLDLRTLPTDAAYVFVPDFAAARVIASVSPWPVTLWPAV